MEKTMFYISVEKELADSLYLIDQVKQSRWMDKNTTIVNCAPNYSSRLSQLLNHKLSHLNKNELFDMITLELPEKNMSQVLDVREGEYRLYDNYLYDWVNHLDKSVKYLFVTSSIFTGKHLNKLKLLLKGRLELESYRFACIYLSQDSILNPDFYVRKFDSPPVFFWENKNL